MYHYYPTVSVDSHGDKNNPRVQCSLDYFLISNNFLEYVVKTDSSITIIQLRKSPKRGPGYWKFNHSSLNDDAFVKALSNNS